MADRTMLVDATQPEETRVAILSEEDGLLQDFDFESQVFQQIKGNIYLAKVTRVEPSLQAAFLEYGGNRQGFLPFTEIHPDYFRIPIADRQKLLEQEEKEMSHDVEDDEDDIADTQEQNVENNGDDHDDDDDVVSDNVETVERDDDDVEVSQDDIKAAKSGDADEVDEDVDQAKPKFRISHRNYKIQEVIKPRQIMLVQVTKEERGNKGAAVTTFISLPGRYCVLMPNSTHGGGVSRKINNSNDRKKMKQILSDLEVPEGMSVILRTAGIGRTKTEIKRDLDYLLRMWNKIRELTLESTAPALVYEEGDLIQRSIRDLYGKEIDDVHVAGKDGYRHAKDFMKMLMPSHAKKIKEYKDEKVPLFQKHGVEKQIGEIFSPTAYMKSGGYIVINPTEALVSIDVNSGRSTKERHIEETALQTNLEAAEEVARQLRLRDLGGLVVIDFIDMEGYRNNRLVEKRLRECLARDRARVQVGRISNFGLLELSRQRLRPSLFETNYQECPTCKGVGRVRTVETAALMILRAVEREAIKNGKTNLLVRVHADVALYILNQKRSIVNEIESSHDVRIYVHAADGFVTGEYELSRDNKIVQSSAIVEEERENAAHSRSHNNNKNNNRNNRRNKNNRNKNESKDDNRNNGNNNGQNNAGPSDDQKDDGGDNNKRKRRRGKRGGRRRNRNEGDNANNGNNNAGNAPQQSSGDNNKPSDNKGSENKSENKGDNKPSVKEDKPAEKKASEKKAAAKKPAAKKESAPKKEGDEKKPARKTAASKSKKADEKSSGKKSDDSVKDMPKASDAPKAASSNDNATKPASNKPKKKGWWQKLKD